MNQLDFSEDDHTPPRVLGRKIAAEVSAEDVAISKRNNQNRIEGSSARKSGFFFDIPEISY